MRSNEIDAPWQTYRTRRLREIDDEQAPGDRSVAGGVDALTAMFERIPALGRVNVYSTRWHVGLQLTPAQAQTLARAFHGDEALAS